MNLVMCSKARKRALKSLAISSLILMGWCGFFRHLYEWDGIEESTYSAHQVVRIGFLENRRHLSAMSRY